MAAGNIVIGWLRACSEQHRERLARRLGGGAGRSGGLSERTLDALAAGLLAECAGDLEMGPGELANLVGNPRRVGREAVLELALVGLQASPSQA